MQPRDPRQERTWSTLRAAVLSEVAARPLAEISVVDLSARAGVSRDTFYRHAASVPDLLARALEEELDALDARFRESTEPRPQLFATAERDLFAHVAAQRAVYRNAMAPRLDERVRTMLVEHLEVALLDYLRANPDVAPPAATPESLRIYAAYGASGTVGAIELWLLDGALGDPDAVASHVLAASASWWWSGS